MFVLAHAVVQPVHCGALRCTLLHAQACCQQHALLEEEHLHHLQANPIAHAQIVGVVLLRQRRRVVLLVSAQHNVLLVAP